MKLEKLIQASPSILPLRECILKGNELPAFAQNTGINFTALDFTFPFHHIVYVEEEICRLVIHSKAFNKEHLRPPSFIDCLGRIPFYDYDSLLFLTTAYTTHVSESFDQLLKRYIANCRGNYFDYWFQPTYGYLLYYFQLERLYCMFTEKSRKEAVSFRHDWNLKKPEAKKTMREIFVRKNLTLLDLVEHRFLNKSQFVYSPNYTGAYILSEWLEKTGVRKLSEFNFLSDPNSPDCT